MTNLDPKTTRRALRRLHGEPADPSDAGGDHDSAHRDSAHRVERLWRALEPPPASPPPPGFAAHTAAALRRRRDAGSWSLAPAWARGTAAAALAAGLLLGVGVGSRVAPSPANPTPAPVAAADRAEAMTGDEADWIPLDDGWSEERWDEAWNQAFDTSFGPADGS